jgi:hypothetical protein
VVWRTGSVRGWEGRPRERRRRWRSLRSQFAPIGWRRLGEVATKVHWKIVGEPESSVLGEVDAESWVWSLENVDSGTIREFCCTVSGPGKMDTAAAVSRHARDSRGRREVEKVLSEEQPPRHVILGVDGYILRL